MMAGVTSVAKRNEVRRFVGTAHGSGKQVVNVSIMCLEIAATGHAAISITL
jgi:hypothetical protein